MMAHNMDVTKGLYPDEEGYKGTFTGFQRERAIEGKVTTKFSYIHPQKFHTKLMKSGDIQIMRSDKPTYTDIKIRNDIEMTENKPAKYFQPKEWNIEKLLFNYDALYHLTGMDIRWYQKYCKMLKMTLRNTYLKYGVPKDEWAIKHWGEDEV
mgnify:FL=1|jgi:hypothetical protein